MRGAQGICAAALCALAAGAGPEQRSLALTENGPSEMSITWASLAPYDASATGKVTWQPAAGGSPQSAAAETSTYSASVGWTGTIFKAVMTGLTPGAAFTYTVCDATGNTTAPQPFKAAIAAAADAPLRVAVLADYGTLQLFGYAVAAALIADHKARPYDIALVAGDLSYATVSPPNGAEFGFAWDAWVRQNEPFASNIPFMMTVGNHESTPGTKTNATGGPYPQEYAAFTQRFRMPRNGNPAEPNFYYNYSIGPAFFVSVDGENDYSVGSAQHAWLDATLAAVDRAVHPWLFAVMHHPVLSSDSDEAPDHTPGGPRSIALEPLFLKYKVDVVFQGHQHNYERSAAVYNGTVLGLPDANNTYNAPPAPIYIVQGNSGAVLDENKWIAPQPWSLVRDGADYGYGEMSLSSSSSSSSSSSTITNHVLEYTFTGSIDHKLHDRWRIVKPAA